MVRMDFKDSLNKVKKISKKVKEIMKVKVKILKMGNLVQMKNQLIKNNLDLSKKKEIALMRKNRIKNSNHNKNNLKKLSIKLETMMMIILVKKEPPVLQTKEKVSQFANRIKKYSKENQRDVDFILFVLQRFYLK